MPKGPKGQKRPADVIGNAVRVMEIATGQRDEEYEEKPAKDKAAAELGRRGGKARAERMTAEQRAEAARKAAAARWAKSLAPSEGE
jgi:hypothetical protein